MNAVPRQFEARPAVREAVGLLIGLVGPSSSGKTFSALRFATGIQRVVGGEIDVIDTENGRAKYYADRFRFNHVPFRSPFSPLDYLDAVRYCARRGAKTIVIDSTSHEHEGSGGVLEWHEAEVQRLSGGDPSKAERIKMLAWAKPKAARRKFINEILQLNVNLILTFRAKEKMKIVKGKDPVELGWMPIAGEEFIYEMVLQLLLKPNSNGVPTWQSEFEGERAIIKLPEQFKDFFAIKQGEPAKTISEDLGQKLAEWAAGGAKPAFPEVDELVADYVKCQDEEAFKALEARRDQLWKKPYPPGEKPRLKQASDGARRRLDDMKKAGSPGSGGVADNQKWIQTATSLAKLSEYQPSWLECTDAYGGLVPLDVSDAYESARERLTELAARQDM